MSDNPLDEKLVRVWDRDYNLRGQQFVLWNAGTFTIPADDPLAIELWDRRELGHQITVESTDEMAWWIDRMDRTKDGTLIVTCRPHVDILRDCTVPDWKLVEVWLSAEKRWKSQQPSSNLRDRIAAVLRDRLLNEIEGAVNGVDNIYVGDYVGESAIHLTALADAVIRELGLPPTWGKPSFENGRTDGRHPA